jgi:hypothetical protein
VPGWCATTLVAGSELAGLPLERTFYDHGVMTLLLGNADLPTGSLLLRRCCAARAKYGLDYRSRMTKRHQWQTRPMVVGDT